MLIYHNSSFNFSSSKMLKIHLNYPENIYTFHPKTFHFWSWKSRHHTFYSFQLKQLHPILIFIPFTGRYVSIYITYCYTFLVLRQNIKCLIDVYCYNLASGDCHAQVYSIKFHVFDIKSLFVYQSICAKSSNRISNR